MKTPVRWFVQATNELNGRLCRRLLTITFQKLAGFGALRDEFAFELRQGRKDAESTCHITRGEVLETLADLAECDRADDWLHVLATMSSIERDQIYSIRGHFDDTQFFGSLFDRRFGWLR